MAYFPEVEAPIPFEGIESRNSLAFRYYEPKRLVAGKPMSEHLRFAVCYWHSMRGTGADPFGAPTFDRRWKTNDETLQAAFEFFGKVGVQFWTFHDRDLAPEASTFTESCGELDRLVARAKVLQQETGVRLLWGTANLFSHPRYQCGAATNPDPRVFAHAAAQVKRAIDATHELGGLGYVFWGGREGYDTLLNTDMKREREQLARFLWLACDYKASIGFGGRFYIEPKPHEPTKHQYDSNAEACLNFLREFGLLDHFWLNLETNHATLAGHSMEHELQVARIAGKLGSVDANVGDPLLGWDTDQFPTDHRLAALVMLEVLRAGGLGSGGLNFDAKLRRASSDPLDLFYAHVGAMDAFARGLIVADRIMQDGALDQWVAERYREWDSPVGERILSSGFDLHKAEEMALSLGEPERRSGRQEMMENLLNTYL